MDEKVENILAEALQASNPEERRAWLERACAGDEDLRREVESLLQAYEQAGDSTGHRSDSAPDQEPKPQPKWSGGPPRPPKKTARGLEDGSPGDDYPLSELLSITGETKRLIELLETTRGSGVVALNSLETDLDKRVVELGELLPRVGMLLREYAMEFLKAARDYRRRHPRLETDDPALREQARKILDERT